MRKIRSIVGATVVVAVSFACSIAHAQSTVTISGYVKDVSNGEALIGANVYVKETLRGAATNVYGYYVLNLEPGKHTLVMSYVGYEDFVQTVDLKIEPETEHRGTAEGDPSA
ncbi:MAG: carboxypeptidase-like regulatory domain-containing protein [Flavobacteriales bacterium]|nr:carboxypeptidase-like regulatory domain-containing protein [Flavobacteriales bacterium]